MKILLASARVLAALPAGAQTPGPQPKTYGPPIGLREAMAIIDRGMERSSIKGLKMVFAVVEPSGELVAFARMDDAPYASNRLAQQKARTSARLRVTTADLEQRVLGGRTVLLSSDEVIAVGGGVPIVANGAVIGALGVSGGTAAEDAEIAKAALTAR